MKRVLCPEIPRAGKPVRISETEAKHLVNVLRLRNGDRVEAIDGHGNAVVAKIRMRGKEDLWIEASEGESVRRAEEGQVIPLVLELSVLKGDAMEWAIEKAVELGVRELQPVLTEHTVVQLDRKGPEAFRERWQRIADQALKQCGRLETMTVALPISLKELLAKKTGLRFWCDEQARSEAPSLLESLAGDFPERILIGPEGGWSETERKLLSQSGTAVSLGSLVLRAETACVYVASVFHAAHLKKPKA